MSDISQIGEKISEQNEHLLNLPDPSWKGFYKWGGITAILYVLLALLVPSFMIMFGEYDFSMDSSSLLKFIASNKVWWMSLQSLVLGTSILAIITFAAIFLSLKHINKSLAGIGSLTAIVCQILFMAYYPVLLGLVYLSDRYAASSGANSASIEAAAEALLAMNNAFNPLYESLFGMGIMIISIVMLKGVYHKSAAYTGIAIGPVAIIALSLWPLIGINYFWWWLLFNFWFIMVGIKLYRLGKN